MDITAVIIIALLFIGLIVIITFILKDKIKYPEQKFPQEWRNILINWVHYYSELDNNDKKRFEHNIQTFLLNCEITGVETDIDDIDRLLVASSAIIPTFGFKKWITYPNLKEVLIYPDTFNEENLSTTGDERNVLGMVGWGYMNGQMILSKRALRQGYTKDSKENVGIHEFVHLLDKIDGATDGIPEYFLNHQYLIPWIKMIHEEINKIRNDNSDIRGYGGVNETEFFAVASEYFFQHPELLEQRHPELFNLLEQVFNQNPE